MTATNRQHRETCPDKHRQSIDQAFAPNIEGDIQNVNVRTEFDVDIDIEEIAKQDWATGSNGWVTISEPIPATANLYEDSSTVIVGADNASEITSAAEYIYNKLTLLGLDPTWNELHVTNVVSSFSRDVNIPLVETTIALGDRIEYEPEQFIGGIYQCENGGTCLLFPTGDIIVQGAETHKDAFEQYRELINELNEFDLLNLDE